MADTPRKTLGLPVKAAGGQSPVSFRRKPLRSGGPKDKRKSVVAIPAGEAKPAMPDSVRAMPAKSLVERAAKRPTTVSEIPVETPPLADATSAPAGIRVSRLMSERGLCSRREADEYIVRGWVYVDGQRVSELGTRAAPTAKITLDKAAQATQQRQMTILLHKPVGYVSGQPEPGFKPAVQLILPENQQRSADTPIFHPSHLKGLAPAGRLDIDSTGLLVLTQDGRIAKLLIGADSTIEKEYLVRVRHLQPGPLPDEQLERLRHGLELDGVALQPAKVSWQNEEQLRFVLREGRKRQIRRMCELVGLEVLALKRVRIGSVALGALPPGQWRYLRPDERF